MRLYQTIFKFFLILISIFPINALGNQENESDAHRKNFGLTFYPQFLKANFNELSFTYDNYCIESFKFKPRYNFSIEIEAFKNIFSRSKLYTRYVHIKTSDISHCTTKNSSLFDEVDNQSYHIERSNTNFHVNIVDLNYGYELKSPKKQFIFYLLGGLTTTLLKQETNFHFTNHYDTRTKSEDFINSFKGVGIQIGLEFSYIFLENLKINIFNLFSSYIGSRKDDSLRKTDVLPLLYQKISISYARNLNNTASIALEVGYKWYDFFNLIPSRSIYLFGRLYPSLGLLELGGPYLGITLNF